MKKPANTKSKAKANVSKSTKATAAKRSVSNKVMLVYGYGEDARPRAAAFTEPDHKLARKAAGLLGLSVFLAPAAEMKSALKGIKSGNVYATGEGFTPKISRKRFEELLSSLKLTPPVPPALMPGLPLPTSWQTIEAGQLVLAPHDDPTLGFWECIVQVIDRESLILRARDFPEVEVKRDRATLAVLYTADYKPVTVDQEVAPGLPVDWQSINPEHMVLANLGPREGWYPAIVTKRDGEKLALHWRDEPTSLFTRRVTDLALIYPTAP